MQQEIYQVRKPQIESPNSNNILIWSIMGIAFGFFAGFGLIMFFVNKYRIKKELVLLKESPLEHRKDFKRLNVAKRLNKGALAFGLGFLPFWIILITIIIAVNSVK